MRNGPLSARARLACCVAVIVVIGLSWLVGTHPAQAQETNRLGNASLESPYYGQGTAGQTVPQGWHLWIGAGAPSSVPDDSARHGQVAWLLKQENTAFTAAGYQRVPVAVGDMVRASAWALVFTCADQTTHCAIPRPPYRQSDTGAGVELQLGIDPQGGSDPQMASVVWSEPVTAYDEWTKLEVETVAASEQVTLFLYVTQAVGLAQNEVYWDQTALTVTASEPPTATPSATRTPSPTRTATTSPTDAPPPTVTVTLSPARTATTSPTDTPRPTIAVTSSPTRTATTSPTDTATATITPSPTNTSRPTLTITSTHTPTPTPLDIAEAAPELATTRGTLCASLFDDTNQNGQREDGEASLRGELNVRRAYWTPFPYITSPNEAEYCFSLDAAEYELYMVPPDDYTMTTSDRLRITLRLGQTMHIAFGAAQGLVEPTYAPAGTSAAANDNPAPAMAAPVISVDPAEAESDTLLDRIYNASAWLALVVVLLIGWAGMRFINRVR